MNDIFDKKRGVRICVCFVTTCFLGTNQPPYAAFRYWDKILSVERVSSIIDVTVDLCLRNWPK